MKKLSKSLFLLFVLSLVVAMCTSCNKNDKCKDGHTWSQWHIDEEATCANVGQKSRTCTVCNEKDQEKINKLDHVWGEWDEHEATCDEAAYKERTCEKCNTTEKESFGTPKHKLIKVEHKDATCKETGLVEHYLCEECGKTFSDENATDELPTVEIPTTDHTYDENDWKSNATHHWHECEVCNEVIGKEAHDGDNCPICDFKPLPSLKEVMTNLANLRNYTYEIDDQIFNVTTTFKYTQNAFYYQPSQELHGGLPYGYAQSANNEIFEFVVENGEVIPGFAERNKDGSYKSDLWNESIISFYDFNLDALPSKASSSNTYIIDDEGNKTLFALLAGYGDVFVLNFVDVMVEVLSENTIKTTLHFSPDNDKYTGDCIGIVKEVGTTELPEIESYLAAGGGPKVANTDDIADFLTSVRESHQFKVEVVSETKHYIDVFNENYYYSYNEMNASDQKGYLVLANKIYQFTMPDGDVKVSNEISYNNNDHSSLWAQNLFKSLASLNMEGFGGDLQEDGTVKLNYNFSIMSSLYGLTHDSNQFASVNSDDYVVFDKMEGKYLSFTYYRYDGTSIKVTISEVNRAANLTIESYIQSGGNLPDPADVSKLKEKFESFATSQTYIIEVTENISWAPTGFTKTGNKKITYTKISYYQQNLTDNSKSFGYGEDETGVYKMDASLEKGEYIKNKSDEVVKGLYENGLFYSFADINLNAMVARQNLDGTFAITDTVTIATILEIAGYNGSVGATPYNNCTVEITNSSVTIKLSSSLYGSITIVITTL